MQQGMNRFSEMIQAFAKATMLGTVRLDFNSGEVLPGLVEQVNLLAMAVAKEVQIGRQTPVEARLVSRSARTARFRGDSSTLPCR
jgi:hypothetical protein